MAFEAGADMLLIAGIDSDDRGRAGDRRPLVLLAAVKLGRIPEDRLNASVLDSGRPRRRRGILSWPGAVAAPPQPSSATLNSPEHRALALEVARKAVTLQRDTGGLLPLSAAQRVLVVVPVAPTRSDVPDDELASSLHDAVRRFAPAAAGASPESAVNASGAAEVRSFWARSTWPRAPISRR